MINTIQHALQGLVNATKRADAAAENIVKAATGQPDEAAYSLDLSEEAVRLMEAKTAYKANVNVLNTLNDMQDELLRTFDEKS